MYVSWFAEDADSSEQRLAFFLTNWTDNPRTTGEFIFASQINFIHKAEKKEGERVASLTVP